jgi:predicted enzyme involved in methoxymalonyl-ACP biosynthesis
MKFKWTGPENWFVGDAGGEGTRMSTFADGYECSEFGGKIKGWKKRGWIKVIK